MPDPLDALRSPVIPKDPDPTFAASLRDRLVRAIFAPAREEPLMEAQLSSRPRNGVRHGDVSYITLGLPDVARGRAFYGSVLGWRFGPSHDDHGAQVDAVVPMIGLWDGDRPGGGRLHGAVLGFRVDEIATAVEAVRAHGGLITDPHQEPYAMAAEGQDDQGIPFYLHEMPSEAARTASSSLEPWNGELEGDVSYLTMVVPDVEAAYAFYGGVFGWTFNSGRAGGAQVSGVAPQMGMTTHPEAGPATPGVILCYRVDDIAAALQRVRDAGGQPGAIRQRPYALESLCADDQGTPFYLHQL
jgi:predicted enzyme related to lactoylglutathione lyase